jgi:Protein of unknown function (DUF429)
MNIYGIDFTSRPSKRKPITVAVCTLEGNTLQLDQLCIADSFTMFDEWLSQPTTWCAAFDFPFGMPRELAQALHWPSDWQAMVRHVSNQSRDHLKTQFKAYCNARPAGQKFAHRATDGPAGSSPAMKWVNPPVAWMFVEGAPRLIASGAAIPSLLNDASRDTNRIALEAYPGLLARRIIGRNSYKSDDKAKQTDERRMQRERIVCALETEAPMGISVRFIDAQQRAAVVDDASGDLLDALLCAVQAAWGWQRRASNYGLPKEVHPLEGWIVSA